MLAHKAGNEKGIPDLLGKSLTYLLRLGQLSANEDLSPIWKELTVSPKNQHPTTLQRDFSNTARCFSICTPIIAILDLLNLTLSLGFILDHQGNLGTGLHQFGLGQHSSAAQKVMKARSDQHQVIVDGDAASSLEDAATLMAPYGVSFLSTMAMVQGAHARLRVVLFTLLGQDYPTALAMRDINAELLEREEELEEYNRRDQGLKTRLPASITRWVQIRLLDLFA